MNRRLFLRLLFVLSLLPTLLLRAAEPLLYLADSAPDATLLLPPPPILGSAEHKAELTTVHRIHDDITSEEIAAIRKEVELSFYDFNDLIGDWFKPGISPEADAFFKRIESETRTVTSAGKNHFKRPRPFDTDPSIVPVEKEGGFSYPSGHSTRGTVFCLVLAELFPLQREALQAAAWQTGFHRVQAGVHYPSDIYAGRTLGEAIVQGFLKSSRFQQDLAVIKASLEKAGKAQSQVAAPASTQAAPEPATAK